MPLATRRATSGLSGSKMTTRAVQIAVCPFASFGTCTSCVEMSK
jgi:hypothetical protein